jgi:hypothetical protein
MCTTLIQEHKTYVRIQIMIGDVRLIAPDVICHLDSKGIRKAIYAADLQPNKMRLATAGGGKMMVLLI